MTTVVIPDTVADALAALQQRPDRLYVLPLTLDVDDLAQLFQRSPDWVRDQVKAGTFPIPHDDSVKHLLWKRIDVERWLQRPAVLAPSRRKAS